MPSGLPWRLPLACYNSRDHHLYWSQEDKDMADTVRKVAYFVMEVSDKPGEAARVLEVLSRRRV